MRKAWPVAPYCLTIRTRNSTSGPLSLTTHSTWPGYTVPETAALNLQDGALRIRAERSEVLAHYKDSSNLVRRANLHHDFSTAPIPWGTWLFDALDFPRAARILEVGCGAGWLWSANEKAAQLSWSPVLSDISAGMVAEARASLNHRDGFSFVTADSQQLPFPDNHFDGLLSCHMLYHVPDRAQAIAEFRRVLRPGGRLFVATNGNQHLREFWQDLGRVIPGTPNMSASLTFGLENGHDQLSRSFRQIALKRFSDALVVPVAQPLVEYARSTGRLDEEQLSQFAQIIQAKLEADGPLRIQKDVGLFVATNH